jgi:ubiquinol-cytochrome c reductase cytochrome b subunit
LNFLSYIFQFFIKLYLFNKNYIISFIDSHIIHYPTLININYSWSFGSLSGLCLVIQIITGLFLALHYTSHIGLVSSSVDLIMRDVNNSLMIRCIHANGFSMFFILVYCLL